ncbi:MAG: 3-hydroxyacyl-CoA dehydrogenase [Paracoccus sp. (in: a-proteobacteria)]
MTKANNITVLGTGVLGNQIAWHSAWMGKTVVAYNPRESSLENGRQAHAALAEAYRADLSATDEQIAATQARITYCTDLAQAVAKADIVIESVPELAEVKTRIYRDMADKLPDHTIILTNSSTLLPRDFAEATGRPEKYSALHFANLIWRLNLTEIMGHPGTSDATYEAAVRFSIDIGMVPIPMAKENEGYILSAWLDVMLNECQTMVTNGIATPEVIDRTYLIANRGAQLPPFGIMDVIGMKTMKNIWEAWGRDRGDEQMSRNARYLQEEFIDKGHLGMATGRGFYSYPAPAYAAPDFLQIPKQSQIANIAAQCRMTA